MLAVSELPWEVFGAGGTAMLVTGILVYVIRMTREQHKECNATIEKVTGEFATAVKNSSDRFAEATSQILREARDGHAARESILIDMLREVRGGPR